MTNHIMGKCAQGLKLTPLLHRIGALTFVAGLLFSTSLAFGQTGPSQTQPFVMATDSDPAAFASKWALLIYTEVFKRLGIPFQIENYALKRRGIQADSGAVDGEASRVIAYGVTHPNLVRVEESLVEYNFALYTANPAVRLQRLEDLRTSPDLLVEYRRGILMCENTLKPLVGIDRLSDVTGEDQGLKKLLAGRTDLYCDIDLYVLQLLNSPEFKNGATKVRKVIDLGKSVPTYPYLHKKHADLAPRMAVVLKKMKEEGLIEAYRHQVAKEMGWGQ